MSSPLSSLRRRLDKMSSDQPATVRELALQILAHDRRDLQALYGLVNALIDLHQFRAAHSALRRFADLPTGTRHQFSLYGARGRYFRELGELRTAERWYRKAAVGQPLYLVFLGGVLARQGRFAEAKRVHRRASRAPVEDNVANDEAFYNLGLILRAERRYKAAIAAFDKAVELDPNYTLAKAERVDALAAMRVVVPKHRRAHWRLLMRTMRRRPAIGHEVARAYVRRYPTHYGGWLALADILATFARYPEAFAAVEKAAEVAVTEAWRESPRGAFIVHWGDVRFAQMDFGRAEYCYRKAVRLRGSRVNGYRVWLAEALVEQGRFSEATVFLRRSLSARRGDPSRAHYLLGLIARSRRQYRQAIKHFDGALYHDRAYKSAREARRDAMKALTVQEQSRKQD